MRIVGISIAIVVLAATANAAVVCAKRNGVLAVRESACKKRETKVELGDLGVVGPPGPSDAYTARFQANFPLPENGTPMDLLELAVPDGSYVVSARLQGVTMPDPDGPPDTDYRYDCYLESAAASIDSWTARVGRAAGVESHLTFEGGFSGAGPITLRCYAGNGHPVTVYSGTLTAIRVGTLH